MREKTSIKSTSIQSVNYKFIKALMTKEKVNVNCKQLVRKENQIKTRRIKMSSCVMILFLASCKLVYKYESADSKCKTVNLTIF